MWLCLYIYVRLFSKNNWTCSFYYASNKPVSFYNLTIPFIFVDSTKLCLIDCSVVSQPRYMFWWEYELTEMKIHFISSTQQRTVVLEKWCSSYFPTNMKIFITCKQRERQSRY